NPANRDVLERKQGSVPSFLGEHRFRYVIKPELAGRMVALPAAVWPMYRHELRGESAPWHVTVESGKR
ncbi:MAG: hypothetical protein ED859_17765, partial [Desulfuromonadales bacterium]